MTHARTVAVVWGSQPPAFSIGYASPPMWPGDSGFTMLFDDAPEPEDIPDVTDHPLISLVCLDCLIDDHPEIGRGLDIAREHGVADLDDNDPVGRGRPQSARARLVPAVIFAPRGAGGVAIATGV